MTTAVTSSSPGVDFERTDAELAAAKAGVTIDEDQEPDFFGQVKFHTWYLPGSKTQYFSFKTLMEGEIAELQSASNSEVVMQRSTGDAKMKVDQAKDRHNLIAKSLTGWQLLRAGAFLPFPTMNNAEGQIKDVLRLLPPHIVAGLEKEIREKNPSLAPERTPEEIQESINQLEEELANAKKREAGKADS